MHRCLDGERTDTTTAYGTADASTTHHQRMNSAGRRQSATDPRGFVTTFDYDSAGRLFPRHRPHPAAQPDDL